VSRREKGGQRVVEVFLRVVRFSDNNYFVEISFLSWQINLEANAWFQVRELCNAKLKGLGDMCSIRNSL